MDKHTGEKHWGLLLTSNRLETSRHVLDTLKNVSREQGPTFLKGSADSALVILEVLRSCDVESIVKDLVDLVLDGCGLVYIIIHTCSEHMDRQTVIARDMKEDAQRLAEQLDSVHTLVSKKVADKNLRHHNPWKRTKDERKINDFHNMLKLYVAKFGGTTKTSIHNLVDELMTKKLNEQDNGKKEEARKAKESLANIQAVGSLASNLENMHIRNDDPQGTRTHSTVPAMASPTSNLGDIYIRSGEPQTNTHSTMPIGMAMPSPSQHSATMHRPAFPIHISNGTATDLGSSKRKRDEEKRAGQSGFVKATKEHHRPWEFPRPAASQSDNHLDSSTPFASKNLGSGDSEDDEAIARALHEQFQREAEDIIRQEQQDQQAAMREAVQEQRRIEEEEMNTSKRPRLSSPTFTPPARPSIPHGHISFDNVVGSGIALGGGSVTVVNGGGNITNTNYHDSFNDHSVRHYYAK